MENSKTAELLRKLAECIYACNTCLDACLDEQNVQMMKECIRLDKMCATVCGCTLSNLYEGNDMLAALLDLCREACEQCGEECSRHEEDHCQKCAAACGQCADACASYL